MGLLAPLSGKRRADVILNPAELQGIGFISMTSWSSPRDGVITLCSSRPARVEALASERHLGSGSLSVCVCVCGCVGVCVCSVPVLQHDTLENNKSIESIQSIS